MILYLECRSYGIALDIPTTRDEAASTIFITFEKNTRRCLKNKYCTKPEYRIS